MKRLILLSIALLIGVVASAQSNNETKSLKLGPNGYEHYKHEFRLTVGANPLEHLEFGWADWNHNSEFLQTDDFLYDGAYKTTCGYSLSYMYSPRKWLAFGLNVGYVGWWQSQFSNTTNALHSTTFEHHIMFVPTVRFSYLNRRYVRLYSSLGIGYGACLVRTRDSNGVPTKHNNYNESFVPVQLTPIGVSVGRKLFGFAELTVGSMANLSAGIGYRF